MHSHEVLIFLLGLAALLGVARLLGELARSIGLPLVVGEIATGVLLGQTGLRRVLPSLHAWLFPRGPAADMLSGYTTVAVVLLLVVAGLDVDLKIVRRHGRTALVAAALGVILPLLGGLALGYLLPESMIGPSPRRGLSALVIGVTLSVSALPVIAKTLLDLGLFKTEIGLLVMTIAMIVDLVSWLAFSSLLGPIQGSGVDVSVLLRTVAIAIGLAAVTVVFGRRLLDRALAWFERDADAAPSRVLSLVAVAAMLGASITHAIGLHTVLGGFLVGVAFGGSPHLRERTRSTIHQFVMHVFAPVFFASLALDVDFATSFDLGLTVIVFLVATASKLIGCGGGGRLAGLPLREALAVAFGLNARGAMGTILALFAREAQLIDDRVFVALITTALTTSVIAGPAMKRALSRKDSALDVSADDAAGLVRDGGFLPLLSATTPARAIEELGQTLRSVIGELVEPAVIAVLEREMVAPTGLGDGVAIPHASVEGLTRPIVALGLSPAGIDFEAHDGQPARIVFLLLLPPKAYEREIRVLAALSRSVFDEAAREALMKVASRQDAIQCLDEHARRIAEKKPGVRMSSLTDF